MAKTKTCVLKCPQTTRSLWKWIWEECKLNLVNSNEALKICVRMNLSVFNMYVQKDLSSRRSPRAHDNKFVCDKVSCPTCSPLIQVLLHQTISHTIPHLWFTQHTHSPLQPLRLTCFPANLFAQLWCDRRPITCRHMMYAHKRERGRKMRKVPPTESPSFLTSPPLTPHFSPMDPLPHSPSPPGPVTYPIPSISSSPTLLSLWL